MSAFFYFSQCAAKGVLFPIRVPSLLSRFSLCHMNCLSQESRDVRQAWPALPCWRKVITLFWRGGGRQGSDGGCRQAEVYTYVGATEKDGPGRDGT